MKTTGGKQNLWQRYLTWRKGEGRTQPKLPEPSINKLAIDEGDVASTVTANRGGGMAGGV